MEEIFTKNIQVENSDKIDKNRGGGRTKPHFNPPSTTTNQLDSYTTVRNIEIETSIKERDWPKFVFKELLDNAFDWLMTFIQKIHIVMNIVKLLPIYGLQIQLIVVLGLCI